MHFSRVQTVCVSPGYGVLGRTGSVVRTSRCASRPRGGQAHSVGQSVLRHLNRLRKAVQVPETPSQLSPGRA